MNFFYIIFVFEFKNEFMKIKHSIIQLLDNNQGYAFIMLSMNVSHSTARDWVKTNSDNLTKAAMLKAIRQRFGLADDEILEEDMVSE